MKTFYEDIINKVKEVTSLQWVTVWNDQINRENTGDGYVFPKPAAFVDIESEAVNQLGNGVTMHDPVRVRIHVVHEMYDSQDGDFDKNLVVLDIVDLVKIKLAAFEPDGSVRFVLTGYEQDTEHTNVYHFILTYTTNYIDQATSEPIGGVEATINTITLTGTFE